MDEHERDRQKIIDSVINKRNAANPGADEQYVSHLKILEPEGDAVKPRHIILTGAPRVFTYLPRSKYLT